MHSFKNKKEWNTNNSSIQHKSNGTTVQFFFTLRKYFHNLFLPKKNAYFRCQLWRVEHTIDEYND